MVAVGIAAKIAADRQVENDVHRVFEDRPVRRFVDRVVQHAVDVEAQLRRLPFDGIDMETRCESLPACRCRSWCSSRIQTDAARSTGRRIDLPVIRAADKQRLAAAVFQDVDLAARGPVCVAVGQQPERRPHALRGRQSRSALQSGRAQMFANSPAAPNDTACHRAAGWSP